MMGSTPVLPMLQEGHPKSVIPVEYTCILAGIKPVYCLQLIAFV
jgi:hypothetical protein